MISIVFIRHGATEGNLDKRYIGSTDEPLCPEGIGQALSLREHGFVSEYIFVSPMKRTVQTAEIVFPDCKYTVEENFRETDFGIFEGKNALELSQNKEYRKWVDSMCTLPIPGGEDVAEFKKRCAEAFLKAVKSVPDGESASFVLHGGVIMAILETLGKDNRDFYDYRMENGEFVVCKFDGEKLEMIK